MPTVEPLHIAMIEKTLRDLYGKALTDNEHQVCEVRFEYEERFGCSMIYEVGAGGDEHTILQMYCYTNRRFAPPRIRGGTRLLQRLEHQHPMAPCLLRRHPARRG